MSVATSTAVAVADAPAADAPAADAPARAVPTLRRLPVPVAEPRPALRVVREVEPEVAADQGVLSFDTGSAGDGESDAATGPAAQRARRLESEAVARFCAAVPTPSSALPDPRRWAAQFVQAAVEVAAGQRPASQLVRWTSEDVHATLARRAQLVARRTRLDGPGASLARRPGSANRVAVHSIRACSPGDGIVEATAVVSDRARVRAVALRLEGLDGRWRVTALEIG